MIGIWRRGGAWVGERAGSELPYPGPEYDGQSVPSHWGVVRVRPIYYSPSFSQQSCDQLCLVRHVYILEVVDHYWAEAAGSQMFASQLRGSRTRGSDQNMVEALVSIQAEPVRNPFFRTGRHGHKEEEEIRLPG